MNPLPKPKSLLGWHRQLAPAAGVKVSPLCLGAMNLGTAWSHFMGAVDEKSSFELLDFFYQEGGNFIDTANAYQDEESETIIGNWMKARNNRDEMVIATKYTHSYKGHLGRQLIQSNYGGMNAKSLKHSLDHSLKKLQTDYVDVLYIHWWDYCAEIPEIMHALNDVVQQGKVIYLAISDTPAWIVAKANEYARGHNLRPFVMYQGLWSAATRDFERDIIPMCRSEGMALAPWGALGQGNFKTAEQRENKEGRKGRPPTEAQIKVSEVLQKVAERKGTQITSIALAYVMHKAPYVFPIVGGRTVEHIKGNIEALAVQLSRDDIEEIENASPFDIGFPSNLFTRGKVRDISGSMSAADNFVNAMFATCDYMPYPQPIQNGIHKDEV